MEGEMGKLEGKVALITGGNGGMDLGHTGGSREERLQAEIEEHLAMQTCP